MVRACVFLWGALCVASGAASCDYRAANGKCCTAANSHGAPGVHLLDGHATVSSREEVKDGGYLVDLRLDLRFLNTEDDLWWPVTWPHLVASHGFELHVFVVDEGLGSVWHVHGEAGLPHADLERPCGDGASVWHTDGGEDCAWVAEDYRARCGTAGSGGALARDGCRCACNTQFAEFFYAKAVPISAGGSYRVLVSYVLDADSTGLCVWEDSLHAHPDGRTTVAEAFASTIRIGYTYTRPIDDRTAWDANATVPAAPKPLNAKGEYRAETLTPREEKSRGGACRGAAGDDVAISLEVTPLPDFTYPPSTAGALDIAAGGLALPVPGCATLRARKGGPWQEECFAAIVCFEESIRTSREPEERWVPVQR